MQQFQVPQFIDVEDRIIGPLTLKQFLYVLGAAGFGLLGWFFLQFFLFVIFVLPIVGLFIAMAFVKINERPLATVLANALNYYLKPRLYLWRHVEEQKRGAVAPTATPESSILDALPKLSEAKLDDLAWSLDIKERIGRE